MACKSQTKQEREEGDEGFEDLSSSALHEIHYGHLNQGFEEEAIRDEVDPVSNKNGLDSQTDYSAVLRGSLLHIFVSFSCILMHAVNRRGFVAKVPLPPDLG